MHVKRVIIKFARMESLPPYFLPLNTRKTFQVNYSESDFLDLCFQGKYHNIILFMTLSCGLQGLFQTLYGKHFKARLEGL